MPFDVLLLLALATVTFTAPGVLGVVVLWTGRVALGAQSAPTGSGAPLPQGTRVFPALVALTALLLAAASSHRAQGDGAAWLCVATAPLSLLAVLPLAVFGWRARARGGTPRQELVRVALPALGALAVVLLVWVTSLMRVVDDLRWQMVTWGF